MSRVSLATPGQPPEDLPPAETAAETFGLAELANVEQPLADPETDVPTPDAGAAVPADQANATEAGEETLVGRELQRGKYRLLALRAAPDDLMQAGVSYVALHTDLQKRLTRRKGKRLQRLRSMDDPEDLAGTGLFEPIASRFLLIAPTYRQIRHRPDCLPDNRPAVRGRSDNSIAPSAQGVE